MSGSSGDFAAPVRRTLLDLCRRVQILGDGAFQIDGGAPDMETSLVTDFPNQRTTEALHSRLAHALYLRWYCGFRPGRAGDLGEDILDVLRAANTSRTGWRRGWKVRAEDPSGQLLLAGQTGEMLADRADVRSDPDLPDYVMVRGSHEDVDSQPGYYYVLGETPNHVYDGAVCSRFYLHLTPDAAPSWVAAVSTQLNRYSIPFRFKILRRAPFGGRRDSGVIYVSRRHASTVADLLVDLGRGTAPLGRGTPLFTQKLAPGLAAADDPPGGESFGMNRMRLVASALVGAGAKADADARMAAIRSRFAAAGLDAGRPWANPRMSPQPRSRRIFVHGLPPISPGSWLEAADRIGASLVRDAMWNGSRCAWVGASIAGPRASSSTSFATTGPDLYSGAAGIALFLTRLGAATGDRSQAEAARGAILNSLAQTTGRAGVGGYTGLSGTLATLLMMRRVDETLVPVDAIQSLIRSLVSSKPSIDDNDILGGRAGAIRVLMHASRDLPDNVGETIEGAMRFGDELIEHATRRAGDQWSWRTVPTPVADHLCGYSHGGAGISLALAELAAVTGQPRYAEAAEAGWRYEISRFDRDAQNWPDFRTESGPGAGARTPSQTSWCHGAPGEALAMTRTLAIAPHFDLVLRPMLDAAIATTVTSLAAQAGASLCHGFSGNSEVLLEVARHRGDETVVEVVRDCAGRWLKRHGQAGDWPSGIPGSAPNPSLMLGLSGVGHHYLNLASAEPASPFII